MNFCVLSCMACKIPSTHIYIGMKAQKAKKLIFFFLPASIIIAALLCLLFFPKRNAEAHEEKRVVTVWNVDTFEGGKGSRTSFLRAVAHTVEGEREGVYFLVSSYTLEGASAALAKGEKPDLLSFGVGLSDGAECSIPLPYSFSGGEFGGKCRAVPWCMGGYFLFSLTDDFEKAGNCAISVGGSNLAFLSAHIERISGEEIEAQAAYVGFLNGKYRYLLGTQRDICRFASRGKTVYRRPLEKYNDLFQYISLTKEEHRGDALAYIAELLSERTQEKLSDIGMFSVKSDTGTRTPCVFSDREALLRIRELCQSEGAKIPDKFLKTI